MLRDVIVQRHSESNQLQRVKHNGKQIIYCENTIANNSKLVLAANVLA